MTNSSSIGLPIFLTICTISVLFLSWYVSAYNTKTEAINQGGEFEHKLPTGKHFLLEILLQLDPILAGVTTGIFTFIVCWTLSYFNTIAVSDTDHPVLMSPLSRNLLKRTKENRGLMSRIICWSRFGLATSSPFVFSLLVGSLTWYKLNV